MKLRSIPFSQLCPSYPNITLSIHCVIFPLTTDNRLFDAIRTANTVDQYDAICTVTTVDQYDAHCTVTTIDQ
jgi:hypothetical protein